MKMSLTKIHFKTSFWGIVFIASATLILHRATNVIAFKMKLKKIPWGHNSHAYY